jgi:nitronate monooxygenase
MKIRTPLSERLGLSVPVIAAPMAGGPSTVELAIACSAAGALGSLGCAVTAPEDMKKQAAAIRARTDKPFGINLFVSSQPASIAPGAQKAAIEALAGYYAELGLPAPQPAAAPYAPDLDQQLAAVEAIRPRVFTVHLGPLQRERVEKLKKQDILLGGSANCVAEAQRLESLGFDFVIAQGGEAGGHRGNYLRDPYESLTGTLALTRMIVRAVKLPIVAAGGIMDGEGIAAVLALGAQAAQLGTAFLSCPESGASPVHKETLLKLTEDETRVTENFSGKPARGLANRFVREMQDAPQLAFPAQNRITGPLRQASAKAGKPDFVALWAGQAAALSRALPAAELIARLETETASALRRAASFVKE